VDSSGRIRQDEVPNPQPPHDPRRKHDGREVVTLVEVDASRERRDTLAGDVANHQSPGMTDDFRCGPMRKLGIGQGDGVKQCVGEIAEAGTEHDGCFRKRRTAPANIGSGLVHPLPCRCRGHASLSYGTPSAPGARDWPMKPASTMMVTRYGIICTNCTGISSPDGSLATPCIWIVMA